MAISPADLDLLARLSAPVRDVLWAGMIGSYHDIHQPLDCSDHEIGDQVSDALERLVNEAHGYGAIVGHGREG